MSPSNQPRDNANTEFLRLLQEDLERENDLPESLQKRLLDRARTLRIERVSKHRWPRTRSPTVRKE